MVEEEEDEEEQVTSKARLCQTCGDIGFKELLLCCSKCQISLEHRYCLAKIPKADDHEFTYTCAQCTSGSVEPSEQSCRKRRRLSQDPRKKQANGISSVADEDGVEALEPDIEKKQANTRSLVTGVEGEVQTKGIALIPQTSDPLLQLSDFSDNNGNPRSHDGIDKNQEIKSTNDVLPEACLEHHRISHKIDQTDVLILDMEMWQAVTSSHVNEVEAEVQAEGMDAPQTSDHILQVADFSDNHGDPHCRQRVEGEVQTKGIALTPQTSDPLLQLSDFSDNNGNPHSHDGIDKNQEIKSTNDVLPETCLEHHRISHKIDQTDVLILDMEMRQAVTSSHVNEVEAEVQAEGMDAPQTSDHILQVADFSDNHGDPHCHPVSDKNQEIKSTFDVLPEACLENHRVSHRTDQTDVPIQDVEKRQVNTRFPLSGVETEVHTGDIALVAQTSDPFLQLANFDENRRNPHCHDVKYDKNQEIRSNGKRLISEGGDKSNIKVKGQESQVSPVASGGAKENSSPHPSGGCSDYVYAKPIIDPSWRGCFDICDEKIGRIVAHLSNKACLKVVEATKLLPAVLCVKMMPRLLAWPKSFDLSSPTDESIALYFFPGNKSAVKSFEQLLNRVINRDLALKVLLENVELLIFSSNQLSRPYQLFNGKYYLWGVYRGRKDAATQEPGVSHIVQTSSNECRTLPSERDKYMKCDAAGSFQKNPCPLGISDGYNRDGYHRDSPWSPLPPNKKIWLERGTRL